MSNVCPNFALKRVLKFLEVLHKLGISVLG